MKVSTKVFLKRGISCTTPSQPVRVPLNLGCIVPVDICTLLSVAVFWGKSRGPLRTFWWALCMSGILLDSRKSRWWGSRTCAHWHTQKERNQRHICRLQAGLEVRLAHSLSSFDNLIQTWGRGFYMNSICTMLEEVEKHWKLLRWCPSIQQTHDCTMVLTEPLCGTAVPCLTGCQPALWLQPWCAHKDKKKQAKRCHSSLQKDW
jgi:hypothetical protein